MLQRRWVIILVFVCVLGIGFWVYAQSPNNHVYIASGHSEWQPIMWRADKEIVGAGPVFVSKIASDLKLTIKSRYEGRWDEVQEKVKDGDVDLLVAAYKTADREKYMDFSEAYTTDPIAIFVKKNQKFSYNQWSDLRQKRGIATIGDSYGQALDEYAKKNLGIERVASVEEAFSALEKGTVDYFIYALYSGERFISEQGLTDKIHALPTYAATENFYIAISKKSPLTAYLPRINELIKRYKKDGTIDRLVAENKTY